MPAVALRSIVAAVVAVAVLSTVGCSTTERAGTTTPTATAIPGPSQITSSSTPMPTPPTASPTPSTSANPASFNKSARSVDDPASIWVVTNKLRPLNPVDYAPTDLVAVPVKYQNKPMLRKEASAAVVSMFAAAAAEGAGGMQAQSAYRSYSTQVSVYNGWVSQLGKAQADLQSARPGTSEHQTGLAIDVSADPLNCTLAACFGDTSQGKWLAANAYRFGFILRYPADKTSVTGYVYEPWHFRYVGVELAGEMHRTGVTTLEEFFGLPAAPNYPN